MTGKEGLIHGNVLDPDNPLRLHLDDAVHQQERMAVWQDFLYLVDVQSHGAPRGNSWIVTGFTATGGERSSRGACGLARTFRLAPPVQLIIFRIAPRGAVFLGCLILWTRF
jgi:hypothetical protein